MDLVFPTPQEAEAAFYEAFQSSNIEAMMAVWDDDADIVCIHPNGRRLQGRAPIHENWLHIFTSGVEMRFEICDGQYFQNALTSVHIVHEYIYMNGDRRRREPVIATNIYRLTNQGWRMILHHASLSPESNTTVDITMPSSTILH